MVFLGGQGVHLWYFLIINYYCVCVCVCVGWLVDFVIWLMLMMYIRYNHMCMMMSCVRLHVVITIFEYKICNNLAILYVDVMVRYYI